MTPEGPHPYDLCSGYDESNRSPSWSTATPSSSPTRRSPSTSAAPTNATIADGTGLGTIRNDDGQPTISINDVSLLEGNSGTTAFVFTVSLSNASAQPITVNFATADGSATLADSDYQGSCRQRDLCSGHDESNRSPSWSTATPSSSPTRPSPSTSAPPTNATIADGTGLGTIRNDDDQPTISINDVSLLGGQQRHDGLRLHGQPVQRQLRRRSPSTSPLRTVRPRSRTATTRAAAGTRDLCPGQTSQTITVLVNGDTKFEPDETFTVNLSAATNATIADGTGLGTIRNDDDQPTISINDVSLLEGNSGTTAFVFTVSLSNASAQAITVNFATADGSATLADSDYQGGAGSVTFAPGTTSQTITVLVNGDTKFEPDETFTVNLSAAANATIADGTGLGTIRNDDDQPTISINDVSLLEGNSGTTAFVFTVSLSNASAQPITVNFATADGSATLADNDYQAGGGSVTFAPGQTSQTITVLVNGDTNVEPDETFFVNLSAPPECHDRDGQGGGTIVNDDARRRVRRHD